VTWTVPTSAREWIRHLNLAPHPEGGFYRETYRSADRIPAAALPERYRGDRSCGTAIYFLLEGTQVSRLHRIHSDELWHFYAGSGLQLHRIERDGGYVALRLGPGAPQALLPAGCWFGATVDDPRAYALVGCTVAPGFDFADFELGDRDALLSRYPDQAALIRLLS